MEQSENFKRKGKPDHGKELQMLVPKANIKTTNRLPYTGRYGSLARSLPIPLPLWLASPDGPEQESPFPRLLPNRCLGPKLSHNTQRGGPGQAGVWLWGGAWLLMG